MALSWFGTMCHSGEPEGIGHVAAPSQIVYRTITRGGCRNNKLLCYNLMKSGRLRVSDSSMVQWFAFVLADCREPNSNLVELDLFGQPLQYRVFIGDV